MTLLERFASGLVREPSGCLVWTKATTKAGYGSIGIGNRKTEKTHRVAWELANGLIPEGLHVLHHCDNPPCCETEPSEEYPEGHLFLGTQADNNADMLAKRRYRNQQVTHCPVGHAYDEANMYLTAAGSRQCKKCRAVRCAAHASTPEAKAAKANYDAARYAELTQSNSKICG
jgi:hypothetical protein